MIGLDTQALQDIHAHLLVLERELEDERQKRMQLEKTIEGIQQLFIKAGEYKGRAPRERRLP